VIYAIPQELTHLRASLTHSHSQQVAHTVFDVGTIDWHDVVLAGSGMGKVNAALVTTLVADRFGCRTVGFSGVVGAPDTATGDRRHRHRRSVIQHSQAHWRTRAYGSTSRAPYRSSTPPIDSATAPSLDCSAESATTDGIAVPGQIVYGTVLSGDQYLSCETTRERLRNELGGQWSRWKAAPWPRSAMRAASPGLSSARCPPSREALLSFDFTAFVDHAAASSATILQRLLPIL
jgi:adenosylhomocysteine nucleosidase